MRPFRSDDRDVGLFASAQQWMGACGRFWTGRLDTLARLLRESDARKSASLKRSDR